MIDLTTISPLTTAVPAAQYFVQDAAANVAVKRKFKVYDDKWHGMAGVLIPFAVEQGGFIHPDSWRSLTDMIRPRYLTVVNNKPTLDPQFHRVNRYLREKLQWILQSALSRHTARLDGYAASMPLFPQGAGAQGAGPMGGQLPPDLEPDLA